MFYLTGWLEGHNGSICSISQKFTFWIFLFWVLSDVEKFDECEYILLVRLISLLLHEYQRMKKASGSRQKVCGPKIVYKSHMLFGNGSMSRVQENFKVQDNFSVYKGTSEKRNLCPRDLLWSYSRSHKFEYRYKEIIFLQQGFSEEICIG